MRCGLPLSVVLSLAACAVDLPDEPGLRCDDGHPCSLGRECVGGFCVEEGGAAGGDSGGGDGAAGGGGATAGGAATAGGGAGGMATAGGSAGGAMLPDAGSVIWRQEVNGFTDVQDFGSATIVIRADAGNQVVSTVQTADDGNDRGTAEVRDAGWLPQLGHGRIKGRFRIPAALNLRASSTFVRLENGANVVVSLAFDNMGRLIVRSDTGFVSNGALTQTISWPGGFLANTDYTVDVAWQRGGYRVLYINGADAGRLTANAPGTALVTPDRLRLGIYRYDGDAGTGWSITLTDWALADGPGVPL